MKSPNLHIRLYVSRLDFEFALYCLGVLRKKGWHYRAWEKRGTIYQQQTAFTSALVTAYARPFTRSDGLPDFPAELKDFDGRENKLHDYMMELRHTYYAHSARKHYTVMPVQTNNSSMDILSGMWPPIERNELSAP